MSTDHEYVPTYTPSTITRRDDPYDLLAYVMIPVDELNPHRVKPTREEIKHSGLEVVVAPQQKQYEVDGKVLSSYTSQCGICLADYEAEDDVRVMKCRHAYHRGCIDKWMETMQNSCPECRSTGVSVSRATPMSNDEIVTLQSQMSPRDSICMLATQFDSVMIPQASRISSTPMNSHQPSLASHTPTPINSHQPSLSSRISPHPGNSRPPRRHRGRGRAGLSANCKTNQSKTRSTKRTRAQRYHVPSIS